MSVVLRVVVVVVLAANPSSYFLVQESNTDSSRCCTTILVVVSSSSSFLEGFNMTFEAFSKILHTNFKLEFYGNRARKNKTLKTSRF